MKMETPFANDMFALIWEAFKKLYPGKECECMWAPKIRDSENGEPVYGVTTFEDGGKVYIDILASVSVVDAVEVFAHELAHVAVGITADHGAEWANAFDAIFEEYNKMGLELGG